MLAKVCSAAVNGIEAYPVEVEVNSAFGDSVIVIVVNKTPNDVSCLITEVCLVHLPGQR